MDASVPCGAVRWVPYSIDTAPSSSFCNCTDCGSPSRLGSTSSTDHEPLNRPKVTTDRYRVEVGVAGPRVWHELAVSLEKDGREFEAPKRPDTRKSMDCDSERIIWDFHLSRRTATPHSYVLVHHTVIGSTSITAKAARTSSTRPLALMSGSQRDSNPL